MISNMLSKRKWEKKLSILDRKCYITGKSLFLKKAYRGRKQIWSIIDNGYTLNDDIWISQSEYNNYRGRNGID